MIICLSVIRLGPVSILCQVSTTAKPEPTDLRLITVFQSLAAMSRQLEDEMKRRYHNSSIILTSKTQAMVTRHCDIQARCVSILFRFCTESSSEQTPATLELVRIRKLRAMVASYENTATVSSIRQFYRR